MIGLEIITGTVSEQLESIRKMGFDYACDGIDPSKFKYQSEEERRLFYVALTRTKNRVYIIAPIHNQSIFLKEIKKYTKKVN